MLSGERLLQRLTRWSAVHADNVLGAGGMRPLAHPRHCSPMCWQAAMHSLFRPCWPAPQVCLQSCPGVLSFAPELIFWLVQALLSSLTSSSALTPAGWPACGMRIPRHAEHM